jgi:hypothetical protein
MEESSSQPFLAAEEEEGKRHEYRLQYRSADEIL